MPRGLYKQTFTNRAYFTFRRQLFNTLQSDLQVMQVVRLYLALDVQYLLDEHRRFNKSVYSQLAVHLGMHKHVAQMLQMVRNSQAFILSEECDVHGHPLWFTSPYLVRPSDPKPRLF